MTAQLTDAELLVQFRTVSDKREQSFTILIRRYQERLYWHIRRMVIDHEDANDILQNVFVKVWKSLDSFREDSQLYTWLYRIATNESITFLKSKKEKIFSANRKCNYRTEEQTHHSRKFFREQS